MPIIVGKLLKPHCFENMKYYANKKAQMTTTIFTRFLRVLDASSFVHGRNILLFTYNSAAHLQLLFSCIYHLLLAIYSETMQ
jgi:hypothetical protein